MKKGIVFDLDGVIVSTDEFHFKAWKKMADEEGVPFDSSINSRLRGVSRMDSLLIILEKSNLNYSQAEKEEMCARKNAYYCEYLKELTPSFLSDEVRDTLIKLREKNIKLAIGSSSKNTKRILNQIGLGDFFGSVADGTMIMHSKPHPEVFLKAASMIGLDPKDCYVVEDAYSGIDAAKDGGFTAIGVGDAFNYKKTDIPLTSFSKILDLF